MHAVVTKHALLLISTHNRKRLGQIVDRILIKVEWVVCNQLLHIIHSPLRKSLADVRPIAHLVAKFRIEMWDLCPPFIVEALDLAEF